MERISPFKVAVTILCLYVFCIMFSFYHNGWFVKPHNSFTISTLSTNCYQPKDWLTGEDTTGTWDIYTPRLDTILDSVYNSCITVDTCGTWELLYTVECPDCVGLYDTTKVVWVVECCNDFGIDGTVDDTEICVDETGEYVIRWSGGTPPYDFRVSGDITIGWTGLGAADSIVQNPISSSPDTTSLRFHVRDAIGCEDSTNVFTIFVHPPVTITEIQSQAVPADTATFDFQIGVQYDWSWTATQANYDVDLDRAGTTSSVSGSFTSVSNFFLGDGMYKITVTDGNGCVAIDSIYLIDSVP